MTAPLHRLSQQLQRLYCLEGQIGRLQVPGAAMEELPWLPVDSMLLALGPEGSGAVQLQLSDGDERIRTLVLEVRRTASWEAIATLLQGLADDLELPLPALAVAGPAGYQLWFSLAEPMARSNGQAFLQALCQRYLADIPARNLILHPSSPDDAPCLPPSCLENGHWSAFIDPTLGAMFRDEPWLEFPPGPEQQADLLASRRSLTKADLERVLAELQQTQPSPVAVDKAPASTAETPLAMAPQDDPKDFLLALMNDPRARTEYRLEAAKALLPYFHTPKN